jgi:hypothetical protein
MSPEQGAMLWLMFIIGLAGMPMVFEGKGIMPKIGYAWMAFWWLPPLAIVWVKGVFG